MTSSDPSVNPPDWAQDLLPWLVRADRAENIAGDLLEEYRESVLPERGRAGANRWYVHQVAGLLWRLSWYFAVALALQFVVRAIADTFVPPESYELRSILSTWGAVGTYLIAGVYGGWRTHRMVGGAFVALAAHAIASVIAIAVTVGLYLTVIVHDEMSRFIFYATGGWGEAVGMPISLTLVVIVLGVLGGFAGQLVAGLRRTRKLG